MLYNFLVAIVRVLFKIFYRIEIEGSKDIGDGPLIICPNHSHIFDPLILAVVLDRPIHFMAKKELFDKKFLGNFLKKVHAFPVDRDKPSINTVRESIKVLKEDKVLGVFMEGTRVKEYSLNNAKAGVAMIAVRSKADILPVKIDASFKAFSKIKLTFRPIISHEDYDKNMSYDEFAKYILKTIYEGDANGNNFSG